jgi:hypothetical protein
MRGPGEQPLRPIASPLTLTLLPARGRTPPTDCSDGSYDTGVTRRSVEERVSEHAQGLMPG